MPSLIAYDAALVGKSIPAQSKGGVPGESRLRGDSCPRIVEFSELVPFLEELVSPELLQNQSSAYSAYSAKKVSVMPIQTLGQPPHGARLLGGENAQICVKTGYMNEGDAYVIKVASGGAEGYGNSGFMMIGSQKSLQIQTMLFDEGILTEMRTAAATCLASSILMPENITKIGIVGGGVQAIWQLRFLRLVTECRQVVVKTTSKETCEKFIEMMKSSEMEMDREWIIHPYSEGEFRNCQLIHTLTPSRSPVLKLEEIGSDIGPCHISCVGADSPGKQELDIEILEKADLLVCDSLVQTFERGEFQQLKSGPKCNQVVEIGQLLNDDALRTKLVDENKPRLTVFDTSGVAIQDVMIATLCQKLVEATA
uniref:Thiomorpholine-carboxylate dehydrogenase n=1 Tax=Helicotheca tamesis TaxID=374047 RepID=A0A7S2HIM6_9STRA|mmetsp:Transcript_18494/g.25444  ORF Transcript_18494/g.25444 Transcript_18494/m.25444 type:complete len:368 (+) Transcript_18494:1-1104(+)